MEITPAIAEYIPDEEDDEEDSASVLRAVAGVLNVVLVLVLVLCMRLVSIMSGLVSVDMEELGAVPATLDDVIFVDDDVVDTRLPNTASKAEVT